MKDVVPRYWTMQGYRVERRWGWDCHGLPIENIVEKELGFKSKKDCHQLPGIFHRAFSVFVFNKKSELLLQKRSKEKFLWPLYWTNSCCSHPKKGEVIKKISREKDLKRNWDLQHASLALSVNYLIRLVLKIRVVKRNYLCFYWFL